MVRVEDSLWTAAQEAADANGEALAEAVRRFLRRYAKTAPTLTRPDGATHSVEDHPAGE